MGILTRNEITSEIYKILGISFFILACAYVVPTLYTFTRPQLPIFFNSWNIFELSFVYDYPRFIGSYLVWFLICYVMFRISFTFFISGWKISKMDKDLDTQYDLTIIGGILSGTTMIYAILLLLQIIPPIYFFPSISIKLAPTIEILGDVDKSILLNTLYFWVMVEVLRLIGARILKIGIKELVTFNEIPEPNFFKALLIRFKVYSILRRLRIIK
ncbi:MAG: hypothetical protein ACTSRG_19720 [Candidatus Helarchaeota archaeon]